ncbi:hypothetical protein ACOMHN_046394 [Nucella lapillus]
MIRGRREGSTYATWFIGFDHASFYTFSGDSHGGSASCEKGLGHVKEIPPPCQITDVTRDSCPFGPM